MNKGTDICNFVHLFGACQVFIRLAGNVTDFFGNFVRSLGRLHDVTCDFLGRIIIGRVHNGVLKQGQSASLIKDDGSIKKGRISKLLGFEGLQRVEIEQASAGDLVAVAGFDDVNIGETIACPDEPTALPLIKVDEPTLQMTFVVNDSPFAGKEGKYFDCKRIEIR